jgi:hypothetical protein
VDDHKLKTIMDRDPFVAELYQDTKHEIEAEKEHDYNEMQRVQKRFDYFKDPNNMEDKWSSEFDLKDTLPDSNEEALSTDFSNDEHDDMYRRYKLLQKKMEQQKEVEYIHYDEMVQTLKAQKRGQKTVHNVGSITNYYERMMMKTIEREEINSSLEHKMTQIKMLH